MLDWETELELQEQFHLLFFHKRQLIEFIFHLKTPRLRKPAQELLKDMSGFSTTEKILVRLALDLWDGSGSADFLEVIQTLDCRLLEQLLKSLRTQGRVGTFNRLTAHG